MRPLACAFALALALLSACGGGGWAVPDHGARDEADVHGERLYRARCAACHRLRDPSEHTVEEWRGAVRDYGREAKLTSDEAALVRGFLVRRASNAPGPGLAGRVLSGR